MTRGFNRLPAPRTLFGRGVGTDGAVVPGDSSLGGECHEPLTDRAQTAPVPRALSHGASPVGRCEPPVSTAEQVQPSSPGAIRDKLPAEVPRSLERHRSRRPAETGTSVGGNRGRPPVRPDVAVARYLRPGRWRPRGRGTVVGGGSDRSDRTGGGLAANGFGRRPPCRPIKLGLLSAARSIIPTWLRTYNMMEHRGHVNSPA